MLYDLHRYMKYFSHTKMRIIEHESLFQTHLIIFKTYQIEQCHYMYSVHSSAVLCHTETLATVPLSSFIVIHHNFND